MGHNHHHSEHGHHHHHSPADTANLSVAFWLNFVFCLLEFVGGFVTNSVAIMSDALHDLGDSLSLGLAWYFQKISKRKRDTKFSYGYKRFSLLGALVNSLVLVIGSVFVLSETIPRLFHPEQSDAKGMLWFAIVGIAVNGAAVLRLKKGESLNERAVMLHLMEDVLGWVAVLIGSLLMLWVDWPIIDPLLSIGITGYVLYNVYGNLKSVLLVVLQAIPEELDESKITEALLKIPNIVGIHDLHLWSMDSQYHIMTVHVVCAPLTSLEQAETIKNEVKHEAEHINIQHVTVEIEAESAMCEQKNC
ncbi:cobalt-zinc-cadmium efflux system protein [Flexibacter flexilis DSM 6793]|uniref:Cobalt-zinc-cadmium efflux system protein n=1 Tax=Flexibacter flexilis DSM 6793 TaxID=927664 RepID=A0A1I1E6Y2_9BACT|nr:cation diffusion facilitator family transporter [Flexibacter flexilis]SFB82402.1 cobalt-zinc-cadmium efflux system protein [Flexibacter flexilis DSM 6793]